MQMLRSRRSFLASLSLAGAASLLDRGGSLAQERPPEITTVRIPTGSLICNAPTYIADELLRAEGFTDIQHVPVTPESSAGPSELMERGELDFGMVYTPPMVVAIEAGSRSTVLAGVHIGCNSLFAHEGIRSVRDLKGKKVAAGLVRQPLIASMAAYVGLDPAKDIEWVSSPFATAKELFLQRKIDAFLALPPDPQDLRARNIGHVIVDSARDRPWSQHFCCVLIANKDFVRKYPVATKRVLRAILKATDLCASDPVAVARRLVDGGFTENYDYALQTLKEVWYNKWRTYDVEDSIRFYSLRLREASMIKSIPNKIIADGTDWRFLNELKRELKG
jgi:NitT/TauT family transport system substrate-binding protein